MVDSHTKYHEICHFHHDVYKDYLLEEVAQRTPIGMNPSSIQLAATLCEKNRWDQRLYYCSPDIILCHAGCL